MFDKGYRFGFNGKEKDNEINVNGGDYDFGARIYDGRLGRWLSLDPLMKKYPSFSAYSAFGNSPILILDPDGKEIINGHDKVTEKQNYIKVQSAMEIVNLVLPELFSSALFKDYKITIKIGPLSSSSEITPSGDGNNTQMSNEKFSSSHNDGKALFGASKTFHSFEDPISCEKGSSTLSIAMKKDESGNPLMVDGKEVLQYTVTTNTPVLVNGVYEYKTEIKEVSATEANDYININKNITIILSDNLIFSKSLASTLAHELGHVQYNIENKATVFAEDELKSTNQSSETEGAIPKENDFDKKVKKVQVKEGEKLANEKANETTGG